MQQNATLGINHRDTKTQRKPRTKKHLTRVSLCLCVSVVNAQCQHGSVFDNSRMTQRIAHTQGSDQGDTHASAHIPVEPILMPGLLEP
jgi:hypothetical protein